jgi:hypothetical protein
VFDGTGSNPTQGTPDSRLSEAAAPSGGCRVSAEAGRNAQDRMLAAAFQIPGIGNTRTPEASTVMDDYFYRPVSAYGARP